MSLPTTDPASHFGRQRARLLELLRTLAFENRQVTLSSGKTSNFYIDTKQVSLTAEGHFLIGQLFWALIQHNAPRVEAFGGMTMGADPLASATSLTSFLAGVPRPAFYVRKEPKGHGTGAYIEGGKSLRPGMAVVVLEDVVTTGASTLRAVERVRAAELEVVHVVALVDRQEGGREAIEELVPLTALFQRQDFLP
jgi:orotate phosphoribosyltransferase